MQFIVGTPRITEENNIVFLRPNTRWNDFSFVTEFYATFVSDNDFIPLGEVKIGFSAQTEDIDTYQTLQHPFQELPGNFFSLGQHPEYYENLRNALTPHELTTYLSALKDIVYDDNIFEIAYRERVFTESLSRFVSISTIKGQFKEILSTGVALKSYGFTYTHEEGECITFQVNPHSKPPTNVHALIGSNGVGKSHILRRIANTLDKKEGSLKKLNGDPISAYDFGQLIYMSLGVFGNPLESVDFNDSKLRKDQTKKKYIGIYKQDTGQLKNIATEMAKEFAESLFNCLKGPKTKHDKLRNALKLLDAGTNFQSIEFEELSQLDSKEQIIAKASSIFASLSSGHASVLYYITSIVEIIEDRTICLLDEPENHLHPPLLASFIRTLSGILSESNGIAIIATHSPVVIQEIPRSCVWKMDSGGVFSRPNIETFGEGIGEITSDVFNLDMRMSGFYFLLRSEANRGVGFKEIIKSYHGQIGSEGRAIIMAHSPKDK